MGIRVLLFLLLIGSAYAQMNVQQILSEETFVEDGEYLSVNHILTNHKNESIMKIKIYEKISNLKSLKECIHCRAEKKGAELVLNVDDIPAYSSLNVSYSAVLDPGNHTINLGHKTYAYRGAGQERLGKDYKITIEKNDNPLIIYMIVGLAIISLFLFSKLIFSSAFY